MAAGVVGAEEGTKPRKILMTLTEFEEYLDELRSSINGNVNMDVNVSQQTGIMTLSTCIADSANERFLVNATLEQ